MMRFPAVPFTGRVLRAALLVSLGVAGAGAPALAQQPGGKSVLALLPAGDRALRLDSEQTGSIRDAASHLLPDGRRLIAWSMTGRAGETVTIDLRAADFDAMLYLVRPDGMETWSDDDSGGGCDARIQLTLPAAGRYTVVASGLDSSAEGDYRLLVRNGIGHAVPEGESCGGPDEDAEPWDMPAPRAAIAIGETVRATLDEAADRARDGSWLHVYEVRGATAGEKLYVLMHSTTLDSFLEVMAGTESGASDDDSGGGCDAMIEWTIPAEGPFYVLANTVSAGETGDYQLTVSRERPAPRSAQCSGASPSWTGEPAGSLAAGQARESRLEQGTPNSAGNLFQIWTVTGAAGSSVTVDLSSDAFDSMLMLLDAEGGVLQTDDDSAGRCDARLTFEIPAGGFARLVATSLGGAREGAYTLRASSQPPARRDGDCTG